MKRLFTVLAITAGISGGCDEPEAALGSSEFLCTSSACKPERGRSDRAATGLDALAVIHAHLKPDDQTVITLGWERVAEADEYAVTRQDPGDGDRWTLLSRVPRDTLVYSDATLERASNYRVMAVVDDETLATSPTVRALPIAKSTYHLRGETVARVPFATDLYGVARYPADLDRGPYPLALLLHGNHGNCRSAAGGDYCATLEGHDCTDAGSTTTPNAEGLAYLAETLAAQGFVAVSISANALNCRGDYIVERAELLQAHLGLWSSWNRGDAASDIAGIRGAVDLDRVVLAGHSRGGEAVAQVPAIVDAAESRFRIAGVFSIAPTDFHAQRVDGIPLGVLLPACDGDVSNLDGRFIYDRSVAAGAAADRTQVLFVGANHNFFNTEWTEDDETETMCERATRVRAGAQQGMLEAAFGAFARAAVGAGPTSRALHAEDTTYEPLVQWAGEPIDLRWSYSAQSREVIDAFDAGDAPETSSRGEANAFAGFEALRVDSGRSPAVLALDVRGAGEADLKRDELDAREYATLSLRVLSTANAAGEANPVDLVLGLVDSDGDRARVRLADHGRLHGAYPALNPLPILHTVRIPLTAMMAEAPELDLDRITTAVLETPDSQGPSALGVSEVEFAQ